MDRSVSSGVSEPWGVGALAGSSMCETVRTGVKPAARAAFCIQVARPGTKSRTLAPPAAATNSTASLTSMAACVGWRASTERAMRAGIAPSGAGSARTATMPTTRLFASRTRISVAQAATPQPPRAQLAGSSSAYEASQTDWSVSVSVGLATRSRATPVFFRPGVLIFLETPQPSTVHRQQWFGDHLDLDAVRIFEVDRRRDAAVGSEVGDAFRFQA